MGNYIKLITIILTFCCTGNWAQMHPVLSIDAQKKIIETSDYGDDNIIVWQNYNYSIPFDPSSPLNLPFEISIEFSAFETQSTSCAYNWNANTECLDFCISSSSDVVTIEFDFVGDHVNNQFAYGKTEHGVIFNDFEELYNYIAGVDFSSITDYTQQKFG